MKLVKLITLAGLAAVILLAGCGGGGDNDDFNFVPGMSADQLVNLGIARLDAAIAQSALPSIATLSEINDPFSQAYSLEPCNNRARFGSSVSIVALRARQLIDALEIDGDSEDEAANALALTARSLIPWRTPTPTPQLGRNTLMLTTGAPLAVTGRSRVADWARVRSAILALNDALNIAVQRTELVRGDSTFRFVIRNFRPNNRQQASITIDQADVQTILAGMYAARAAVNLVQVWQLDWGAFDYSQRIAQRFPSLANGADINASQYLPPAPFGTPVTDAVARMSIVKSNLAVTADRALQAVDALQARNGTTLHLIALPASTDYADLKQDIQKLKNALDRPQTFYDDDGTPVIVNLPVWFANPPSLRNLMPTYTRQGTVLITTYTRYPDQTLAGLLPDPPNRDTTVSVNLTEPVSALTVSAFELLYKD